jgi:hypothetical protein
MVPPSSESRRNAAVSAVSILDLSYKSPAGNRRGIGDKA